MHIVIPVSHVDVHLAESLCDRIINLGGIRDYPVTVVSSRRLGDGAAPLVEKIKPFCESVDWVKLDTELERGWPRSANHMFQCAAHDAMIKHPSDPWYFMEADCTPLHAGWANKLETAYNRGGRPFMGAINITRMRNPATGEQVEKGTHMVGSGIYPGNLAAHSNIWRYLITNPRPYDVAMQWEIVPKCTPTDLIQHNWGTVSYRYDKSGNIVCDSRDPSPIYARYARPVSPDAAVLHGCKDGSLAALLGGGSPRARGNAYVASAAPVDNVAVESLVPKRASKKAPVTPPPVSGESDLRARVLEMGKDLGVATISKRTGLSRAEVKEILESAGEAP